MRLLRLHIQGFKSFRDRTAIHFDDNITGIVGPNGCGKSNIVDALFWVMGEQSAKHLRGKSMKDLIFAGSSKYAPASFAEVTLVLSNESGKHIHLGNQVIRPQEIQLTRKLYRNGETEYRINGTPARLKDIHEVFMDTGAGAKSYSIIAQGEIDRLVQAKPVERRMMIEEVAGITKFKMRKKESLKKIEKTESNLNRLNDLQIEISKNLKTLEKQAEKASKARTLKERIQKNDLTVSSHKEFDFLTGFMESQTKFSEQKRELEELEIKKNQLELTLEDERLKKDELSTQTEEAQEEYNILSKKLAAGEERLTYLKKSIEEKSHQLDLRMKENEELEQDIEQRQERIKSLGSELEELQQFDPQETGLDQLKEKVEGLKEKLNSEEAELSELRKKRASLNGERQKLEQDIFQNEKQQESDAQNLKDIIEEMDELEKGSSNFTEELEKQRAELFEAKKQYESFVAELEKTESNLEEKTALYKEKDPEARRLSQELVKTESRKQSLEEIIRSGEDLSEGAKKFLKEEGSGEFSFFGSKIKAQEEYAPAVEALLSDYLKAVVSKAGSEDKLFDWFSDQEGLGYTFLLPNMNADLSNKSSELEALGLKNARPLAEIIQIESQELKARYQKLFEGFYIVEELSFGQFITKGSLSSDVRGVASIDGRFIIRNNGAGLSLIQPGERSEGVVQRKNEIEKLAREVEEKKSSLDHIEAELATLSSEIDQLKDKEKSQKAQKEQFYTSYVSLKSSLESREGALDSSNARMDILTNRRAQISENRLNLQEKEEKLTAEKEELEEQLAAIESEISEKESVVADLQIEHGQEKDAFMQKEVAAKSYDSQLRNLNSQIEDVKSQVERFFQKRDGNKELMEKYREEMDLGENDIEHLQEENSKMVTELKEKEQTLSTVRDELTELLNHMQERETSVKDMTSKINKLEKSNVELEIKVSKTIEDEELLVRDFFERHQIDLRQSVSKEIEGVDAVLPELNETSSMYLMEAEEGMKTLEAIDFEFVKKYPGQVKEAKEKLKQYKSELNRLGEINWQAVEDYERQKLRYDFLKVQEQELKQSLHDLQIAIDHIDEKSKKRFKEAYEAVNSRFVKVFPIIFGGGNAKLEITGSLDDAECGIEIIAQPPGKKMQNINLMSGGEKAMTAVSLIFSIFLVKPSPFCLLDEVDAPLDDANVGRFNELLREMSDDSQFILITHNKKTMELNDTLYGVTMQEPGISKAVSVQLH